MRNAHGRAAALVCHFGGPRAHSAASRRWHGVRRLPHARRCVCAPHHPVRVPPELQLESWSLPACALPPPHTHSANAVAGAGGLGGVLLGGVVMLACPLTVVPTAMFYGMAATIASPSFLWWSVVAAVMAFSTVRRDLDASCCCCLRVCWRGRQRSAPHAATGVTESPTDS